MAEVTGQYNTQPKEFFEWLEKTPVVYNAGESFYNFTHRQNFPIELFSGKMIITGDFLPVKHKDIVIKPFPYHHMINVENCLTEIEKLNPKRFYVSSNGALSKPRDKFVEFLNKNHRSQGWISYHERRQFVPSERHNKLSHQNKRRQVWHKPKEYWLTQWDLGIETGSQIETFVFPMVTEKTWIPLKIGKPFLMFGHSGMYKFLKENGFQLYNEIIDYSFDSKKHKDSVRFSMFLDEINKLVKESKPLTKETEEKIEINKNVYKRLLIKANKQEKACHFYRDNSFLG